MDDKKGPSQTGTGRQLASRVAFDRARRLRKKADAFDTLGHMIEAAVEFDRITEEQEEEIWALMVDSRF